MMLFTKEQIEKIKDVLNNRGNVAIKISQLPISKSTYGMYGETIYGEPLNTYILLNTRVSHYLDKVEIVIYNSISEDVFKYYLLRKIQGKGYTRNYVEAICTIIESKLFNSNGDYIIYNNYVVDIDFYKL